MVLNFFGATEPHKFYTCIPQTFNGRKNKMCSFSSNSKYKYRTTYCIGVPVVACIVWTHNHCSKKRAAEPLNRLTEPLGLARTQGKSHCSNIVLYDCITGPNDQQTRMPARRCLYVNPNYVSTLRFSLVCFCALCYIVHPSCDAEIEQLQRESEPDSGN